MDGLIIVFSIIVLFGLLLLVDKKVKGNSSVLSKLFSIIGISILLFGFVCLYGQTILNLCQVNVKSLTNLKDFFESRIIATIALFILYLFACIKTLYVIITLIQKRVFERGEKVFTLVSIVFDIAVIPNIAFSGSKFLFIPVILLIVEIGLALIKLVFSNFNKENKGVIYA